MRIVLTVALVTSAVGLTALPASSAEAKTAQEYVVQVDPRLCPSPMCGGYWIALANRPRTRCHDRVYRARCYMASAHPASRTIEDGALVRGGISTQSVPGFGTLGLLITLNVRQPAGSAPASGSFYRVYDTGLRCVRAPCFSYGVIRLNTPIRSRVSGVELASAGLTPRELALAEAAAATRSGVLARGRFVRGVDGGRVFRATRVFLRAPLPSG